MVVVTIAGERAREKILMVLEEIPSASLTTIRMEVKMSRTAVQFHLKNMEDEGWISRAGCGACGSEIWQIHKGT